MRDGVLEGNLAINGTVDPRIVVERVWLLLKRVQQLGVREIRGDIVLDRSAFSAPNRTLAISTASRCARTTCAPMPCC